MYKLWKYSLTKFHLIKIISIFNNRKPITSKCKVFLIYLIINTTGAEKLIE